VAATAHDAKELDGMPRRKTQQHSPANPSFAETTDNWEFGGARPPRDPAPRRRRTRRAASTLAFAVLFFGGAAFTAVAGDRYSRLTQDDAAAPADTTSGELTTTLSTDATTTTTTEATDTVPADTETPATTPDTAITAPELDSADVPQRSAPQDSASAGPADSSAGRAKTAKARPRHPRSRVVLLPTVRPAPKPEIEGPQRFATIWLNDPLPDPTPPAKRLSRAFADELVDVARGSDVKWPLVLGVLRAQGATGTEPVDPRTLRRVADRLESLAQGNQSSWAIALAYGGSPTFADRALALARYDRAVGLNALVHGLEAAKKSLSQRLLDDPAILIYPGGRDDIARGKVDVRVLALIAYLHESFGEVTVSCLISGHRLFARPGVISAHIYGRAVDIAALGGTPILGHQAPGGLTEQAVRDILLLPAEEMPKQVISLLGLGGPSFSLADHYNHIHIGY
jgi:hypothetical protein